VETGKEIKKGKQTCGQILENHSKSCLRQFGKASFWGLLGIILEGNFGIYFILILIQIIINNVGLIQMGVSLLFFP
jgi:hypothetical protein